jgi:hypothetical protein
MSAGKGSSDFFFFEVKLGWRSGVSAMVVVPVMAVWRKDERAAIERESEMQDHNAASICSRR